MHRHALDVLSKCVAAMVKQAPNGLLSCAFDAIVPVAAASSRPNRSVSTRYFAEWPRHVSNVARRAVVCRWLTREPGHRHARLTVHS